jgi:GNAT superfamily N-acetyltransferase
MIFASEPDPEVSHLRPRLVDAQLHRDEKEHWQKWPDEQAAAERKIMDKPGITIVPAEVEKVVASGLLDKLDADLLSRYPGEPVNGVDASEFRAAGGYFVIASCDSQLAGCGAFRPLDAETVEIKRMYVEPRFRGLGIARAVLHAIEAEARRRGYVRSILETGQRMNQAIALYRSCGYADIEPFGIYVGSTRSVCLGKPL